QHERPLWICRVNQFQIVSFQRGLPGWSCSVLPSSAAQLLGPCVMCGRAQPSWHVVGGPPTPSVFDCLLLRNNQTTLPAGRIARQSFHVCLLSPRAGE
ncbi:MAG: hypothetical protein EBZ51_12460, partial [Synechococcaceae bacterium WB9_2_112]|nr:hypothetical protein [Synechococcaceae bacterium WB9_2_112]